MKRAWLIGALAMFGSTVVATAQAQEMAQSQAPKDAHAYIISPQDGEVVNSSFKVKFGLSGMGVAPAGVDVKNTGHHHLLVDMDSLAALSPATRTLPIGSIRFAMASLDMPS